MNWEGRRRVFVSVDLERVEAVMGGTILEAGGEGEGMLESGEGSHNKKLIFPMVAHRFFGGDTEWRKGADA